MVQDNGGGGAARDKKISRILLTFNREDFTMAIGGETENLDEALAMLEMAHRDFEARLRAAQVKQVLTAPSGAAFPQLPHRRQ
jgi:hypothetical protein